MPQFDSTTRTKIAALRTRKDNGEKIEVYELVKVEWPAPDGTIYYGVLQTDEIASVAPPVSPIEVRLVPDNSPNWFLPVKIGATIGDEEVELVFEDFDGAISDLLVTHGEGIKTTLYYWFPQEELLVPLWQGHLRNEEEAEVGFVTLKAVQGFRSADINVPGRAHYQQCQAVFGGLLETQEQIDEGDCPYNFHLGGLIGNNNPATSAPWTFCDRRDHASCTARAVDPIFHLSHLSIGSTVINNQTSGPRLYSTSLGNETNLKEPLRVVMGYRRIYSMPVMAFRRDLNNNHPDQGWFFAMYEGPEGPLSVNPFTNAIITVGGEEKQAIGMHYGDRRGTRGQVPWTGLSEHGYSGTSFIVYNFGPIDPSDVNPGDASASAFVNGGLSNVKILAALEVDDTESVTTNRVWQIGRMLCDKRWGFGEDYAKFNRASWIAAAEWVADFVTFTDPFGTAWPHTRGSSNVELIGRKVQQQFDDMCLAGRLSRPFLFDGEIHIEPLRALTELELADCPVFTDEGDAPNVLVEQKNGVEISTLKISRKSDLDFPNRIECTYDAAINDYLETPLAPVEDVDAQLRAGRVVGDHARKTNVKKYSLLGITDEAQALKIAWSILDLGPFDEGGLQNNLRIKFKCWFAEAVDLYPHKVIKYVSSRLDRYGFTYFRILADGIERDDDLTYTITAQAYNETYMATFETTYEPPDPGDPFPDPGPGGGDDPPPCVLQFGDIKHRDGVLLMRIEECL